MKKSRFSEQQIAFILRIGCDFTAKDLWRPSSRRGLGAAFGSSVNGHAPASGGYLRPTGGDARIAINLPDFQQPKLICI